MKTVAKKVVSDRVAAAVPVAQKPKQDKKRKAPAQQVPEAAEQKIVKSSSNKKVKLSADLRPVDAAPVAVVKAASREPQAGSIVYLGHIPDGFFEPQMEKFFAQFGEVKRIKLFRSKKTNNSRGYAFIEFESADVAAVVAESMDGYFLMERKMVCNVVPADKVHNKMFAKPKARTAASSDSDDSEEEAEKTVDGSNFDRVSRLHSKSMQQKQSKLRDLGIDYEIPFAKPFDERIAPAAKPETEAKTPKKKAAALASAPVEEAPVTKTPKKKPATAAPVEAPVVAAEPEPVVVVKTPKKKAAPTAATTPAPVEEPVAKTPKKKASAAVVEAVAVEEPVAKKAAIKTPKKK